MNFGREEDVGRRVGMYLTIMSLGALAGPPIAGAINARTGGFEEMGLYAGTSRTLFLALCELVRDEPIGTADFRRFMYGRCKVFGFRTLGRASLTWV
jgi:hypothetical protein